MGSFLTGFDALQGNGDSAFLQEGHHRLIGGLRGFEKVHHDVIDADAVGEAAPFAATAT